MFYFPYSSGLISVFVLLQQQSFPSGINKGLSDLISSVSFWLYRRLQRK